MRVVVRWFGLIAVLGLCSCTPHVPSGYFRCNADDECPEGWSCQQSLCYAPGTDVKPSMKGDGRVDDIPDAADDVRDSGASDGPIAPPPEDAPSGPPPASPADSGPKVDAAGVPVVPVVVDPPACEAKPVGSDGILVSPAGMDTPDCGGTLGPCASIQFGMQRALNTDKTRVYLDSGRYIESLVLLPGMQLIGGWNNINGTWTRKCSAMRNAAAVIASPSEIAVRAEYDGEATLDTLTIETHKLEAAQGKSVYGVFARGVATRLKLHDVDIRAADGGAGASGPAGATPAAASGTCPEADGAAATLAGAPGAGGPLGSFDAEGYTPVSGGAGGPGARGNNGTLRAPTCITCLSSCNTDTCTGTPDGNSSCGTAGMAGCGGEPAAGGGGGSGGGASIALYVWGARVTVEAGAISSGDGGAGGPGGEPGQGGAGSSGIDGAAGGACTICTRGNIFVRDPILPPIKVLPNNFGVTPSAGLDAEPDWQVIEKPVLLPCQSGTGRGAAGKAGIGGSGSAGGQGGGGAGGPSYGVFVGGAGSAQISESTRITPGQPGAGAGTGAPGESLAVKMP